MDIIKTKIDGVYVLIPRVFGDYRGFFMESWSKKTMDEAGLFYDFVQDNHSLSTVKGTLRGIHFQKGDKSQAKLVRVVTGAVLDVAVDLRQSSPTFGKYVSAELSEENQRQFFIPRGFAHGFLVLSEEAIFIYKVDNAYVPQAEASIRFNDETIGIEWPIAEEQLLLSPKDKTAPSFRDATYFE